jgi:PAS domain S-box-containing protein
LNQDKLLVECEDPAHTSAFAVVVVNDEHLLNVLADLVRKAGLGILTYTSAETALSEMSAWTLAAGWDHRALPALIITDIYMPGIDGWSFCRLLRSPEYTSFNDIPILVVSATFAGPEADRIVVDLGAEAFLPSPIDGKRFSEQVRAILSGKHVRSPLRVLIVEDSKAQAGIIKRTFVAHGYQADIASTVTAATDAFRKTAYDAAVLDYHLPDGTGDTLLDSFRTQRPDCVCLMMTTDPGPELALDWIKRGAAAYLRKPFQPDYLIELCDRARRERSMLRVQDLLEVRTHELRESEERYRSILNACPDNITITDLEGRILMTSPVTLTMFNCDEEKEMLGRLVTDFLVPDDRKRASANITLMSQVVTLGSRYYLGLRLDGSTFNMELNSAFIRGIDRQPTKIVFVVRDITKRKQAEEEKAKLQTKLEQAQKLESMGRLAGGVAHDFNNMLGVILGHTDLAMCKTDEKQPLYEHFRKIRDAAQRSAALTQQLLAFARCQTIAPKVLNVNTVIADTLHMLRLLIGENIVVNWLPGDEVYPVKIDPNQFGQLLVNLCVNARDAISGTGLISIEAERMILDEAYCASNAFLVPGDYIMLTVSDNGCGMVKEIQAKIFEPFFTTKGVGCGTGLGLATVYGIVKQNNGFIDVYSEPGQGTAFKIYFPRYDGSVVKDRGENVDGIPRSSGERVLVVEDEAPLLEINTTMLVGLGYKVLAAGTPGEALRLAAEHAGTIDLLMTDVVMPEMDGRQLEQRIQNSNPKVRCLFMSGYTANVISHHGVLSEGVHFIQKPFTLKDMAMKVREILDEESEDKMGN